MITGALVRGSGRSPCVSLATLMSAHITLSYRSAGRRRLTGDRAAGSRGVSESKLPPGHPITLQWGTVRPEPALASPVHVNSRL
jgi:hypothetical protein